MHGRTIQIFLPNGTTGGLKITEILSKKGKMYSIPRNKLSEASERSELFGLGVYFLIGFDDQKDNFRVYVGETENCIKRLKEHNKEQDFWSQALVFTKVDIFTKTHVKYLEWYCHKKILKANRYILENSNKPSKTHINEPMEADLLDIYSTLEILTSTLGHPIFDSKIKSTDIADIYICKVRDILARGQYTNEGFVVFKGSQATKEIKPKSIWPSSIKKRNNLMESGVLKLIEDKLIFQDDCIFPSPSAAATIIKGHEANGWVEWKRESDSKTLDEVERN